ncbi:MAG: hypothetical protein LH647_19040 [Leptolyngbyaceae cyanobacterium CAN_BIN12]|nr:hypothetical protein [Leptolyngbyaceae cyanobacterium CAN_BIN12]
MAVVEAGELFEQTIQIEYQEYGLQQRRIVLRLAQPTRHGDQEIVILSNLPQTAASPTVVSQLYRERWQVEGLFLSVTTHFEGEIKTLAYPKAALFSFALAVNQLQHFSNAQSRFNECSWGGTRGEGV